MTAIIRYWDAQRRRVSLGKTDGNRIWRLPHAQLEDLLEAWARNGPGAWATAGGASGSLDAVRLLSPAYRPSKVVAIGLNYPMHAQEGQTETPDQPLVLAKFPSSIIGPHELISWDRDLTSFVDYEAELAIVIGREARRIPVGAALDHIFGYTCLNDVSARDLQFSDGQWVRAKSLDSFCPIGPWIRTSDEVPDPQTLAISCSVNGREMQRASTSEMVFSVAEIVSHLSSAFTLYPGDVVATGTPGGIGYFRVPQYALQDGDVVTVAIEGIGRLTNTVELRTAR